MSSGAVAAGIMIRCVLEGTLVMQEIEVQRRPYHRNCRCALHDFKSNVCSSACSSNTRNIKFPKKKSWNDCSLSVAKSQFSSLLGNMESKPSMGLCYIEDGQNRR